MPYKELKTRIKWRRDTSANWTSNNPVLLDGEVIVVDTDSGETRFKIGDGVKTYTQLPFEDEAVRNLINNTFDAAVPKSGGTMTGSLILSADPTQDLEASTKQYVDNKALTINANIAELSTDVAYINATDNENITDVETEAVTNAVLYTPQTLTENRKAQARENIGAVPLPPTAAVGQYFRVSAVDENGVVTAVEAVDVLAGGDGTWRTIAEIQTDGTVNQYEITQDADGNPLNLTEMIIRYVGLKGETVNSYQSVWINDVQVSYRHALTTTSATKYETFWMRKTGKYIYGICNEATKDGISGMNTAWRAGGIYLSSEVFPNDEGIQKIKLGNSYGAETNYLNGITITIFGK